MNFIELNKWRGDSMPISIHTMMITALEEVNVEPKKTIIHLMGGQSFDVSDTILEIKKKIRDSETFKLPLGPK